MAWETKGSCLKGGTLAVGDWGAQRYVAWQSKGSCLWEVGGAQRCVAWGAKGRCLKEAGQGTRGGAEDLAVGYKWGKGSWDISNEKVLPS